MSTQEQNNKSEEMTILRVGAQSGPNSTLAKWQELQVALSHLEVGCSLETRVYSKWNPLWDSMQTYTCYELSIEAPTGRLIIKGEDS